MVCPILGAASVASVCERNVAGVRNEPPAERSQAIMTLGGRNINLKLKARKPMCACICNKIVSWPVIKMYT